MRRRGRDRQLRRALRSEFSEISISRHIDRSGEGVYRLNGARCRLVDVIEVLSDSGLGKEMHSVISQGRVEAIIHSKPADRTVLIEEAAGLSKHRKRRRRAQLKLERTQDNLDRALDVEREARSRLRPLKRQAEAAELHARLERQSLELRGQLTAGLAAGGARGARRGRARRGRGAPAAATSSSAEQSEVARTPRADRARPRRARPGAGAAVLAALRHAFGRRADRDPARIGARHRARRSEARLRAVAPGARGRDGSDGRGRRRTGSARRSRPSSRSSTATATRASPTSSRRSSASGARRTCAARRELARGVRVERRRARQAESAADEARERRAASRRAEARPRASAAGLEVELEALVERQRLARRRRRPSLAEKVTVDDGYEAALAARSAAA